MKKRLSLFLVLLLLLGNIMIIPSGCSLLHRSNRDKVERKQAEEKKKADKEYAKAKKQHLKNQSKKTRFMMKKSGKHAKKLNKPKKRSILSSKKCS